jgi:hypothetical protein
VLAPAALALKPHGAALEHAAQQEFPQLALRAKAAAAADDTVSRILRTRMAISFSR